MTYRFRSGETFISALHGFLIKIRMITMRARRFAQSLEWFALGLSLIHI